MGGLVTPPGGAESPQFPTRPCSYLIVWDFGFKCASKNRHFASGRLVAPEVTLCLEVICYNIFLIMVDQLRMVGHGLVSYECSVTILFRYHIFPEAS